MTDLIEQNRPAVADLCRQFGVASLEAFGSAVTGDFDPDRSDIDFIVEFAPGQDLGPWMSHYIKFKEALQTLLGRSVDLVMSTAMKDPYFIREANKTRRQVYAA